MTSTSDLTGSIRHFADREFKALVTIETAERLAAKAHRALDAGDITEAQRLLVALTDTTTARTATAVKDQQISDEISKRAAEAVARVLAAKPTAPEATGDEDTEQARLRVSDDDYAQSGLIGRPDRPGGV